MKAQTDIGKEIHALGHRNNVCPGRETGKGPVWQKLSEGQSGTRRG